MKNKIQLIEKEISSPNSMVRISEDLDRNYTKVTGISVLHHIGDKHLFRAFTIDRVEVFPKNFEVAFLQSNAHVSPQHRFFPLEEKADGKKIEIDFQDVPGDSYDPYPLNDDFPPGTDSDADSVKYPYTLKIYLELSND